MSWGRKQDRHSLLPGYAAQEVDGLLGAVKVKVGQAEGLSSNNRRGWRARAWAMSTFCCSPPDSAPTRASEVPSRPRTRAALRPGPAWRRP